jgi:hypothetical protein
MARLLLRGPARSALRFSALAVALLALAAGAAVRAAAPAAAASGGLVAAYSFDEGAGSSVADASANGNTGAIAGAAWSASGKFGGALSFDGSSSVVTVQDAPSLDLTTGMTLEAWVNPAAAGTTWRTAVLKEQDGAAGLVYALYANADSGRPAASAFVGADSNVQAGSAPLGVWTFLAATYDGAILRLFVNGAQVGTLPLGGPMLTSAGPLRIGGNGVWNEWFQGRIDNVRVYDRPLSQLELLADMSTPVG